MVLFLTLGSWRGIEKVSVLEEGKRRSLVQGEINTQEIWPTISRLLFVFQVKKTPKKMAERSKDCCALGIFKNPGVPKAGSLHSPATWGSNFQRTDVTWRDVTWRDVTWRDVTDESSSRPRSRWLHCNAPFPAPLLPKEPAKKCVFSKKDSEQFVCPKCSRGLIQHGTTQRAEDLQKRPRQSPPAKRSPATPHPDPTLWPPRPDMPHPQFTI